MRGSFKRREAEEKHAFFILLLSALAITWWVALWGLVEEYIEYIEETYDMSKTKLYIYILIAITGIIVLFPELLEKF